ncbi:MAG TPA: methyltransferase domain-containing protein [Nitriliruptorales bacterium]|nr:methyltransferase domain-containing protein [Nitriliruptorales bacterium]
MVTDEIERNDLETLRAAESYQRWVVECFAGVLRGRVVQVGAGVGHFTRWFAEYAEHVVALESDPAMCAALEDLQLGNVEVVRSGVEHYALAGNARFDVAVLIDVLQLFEDDVACIRASGRLLRIDGHLCALAPAHPALHGSLDDRYGHHRRYTKQRMVKLFQAAGLAIEELRYFNALGALGWLGASRLARRPRLDPALVWLSERITVPAGRLLERVQAPPFGQSVLAIGRQR